LFLFFFGWVRREVGDISIMEIMWGRKKRGEREGREEREKRGKKGGGGVGVRVWRGRTWGECKGRGRMNMCG
jgi:hypothetical protein